MTMMHHSMIQSKADILEEVNALLQMVEWHTVRRSDACIGKITVSKGTQIGAPIDEPIFRDLR